MIQISDRRLSSKGKLVDDESNKAGVLFCDNARMTFGYTGLANFSGFSTMKWLLKALSESAAPDYTIGEILERLKANATKTFAEHRALKATSPGLKKLAVMFSGYLILDGEVRLGSATLSNYHNFQTDNFFPVAQKHFQIKHLSANHGAEWPTLICSIGNWNALPNDHIDELIEFLIQKKPSTALVRKTIEMIKTMSDSPKSEGTIGKQLMCVIIPKNHELAVECNYYSNHTKAETFFPDIVYAMSNKNMVLENIKLEPVEKTTPPLSVPKVPKNSPCPCGSLKRYKNCHGRKKKK